MLYGETMKQPFDNIELLNRIRAKYWQRDLSIPSLAKAMGLDGGTMSRALQGQASERVYNLIGAWLAQHIEEYPCPNSESDKSGKP